MTIFEDIIWLDAIVDKMRLLFIPGVIKYWPGWSDVYYCHAAYGYG